MFLEEHDHAQVMHVLMFGPRRLQNHTFSALSGAAACAGADVCRLGELPVEGWQTVEAMPLEPWPRVLLP